MKLPDNKKLFTIGASVVALLLVGVGAAKQFKRNKNGGGNPAAVVQTGGDKSAQPAAGAPPPPTSPDLPAAPATGNQIPEETIDAVKRRIQEAPESKYPEGQKNQMIGLLSSANGIELVTTVPFGKESTNIPEDSLATLRSLKDGSLAGFNRSPREFLLAVGYASPDGPATLNLELAEKRTKSVADSMISELRLDGTRIREISVGETEILNDEDKTRNRAVEIWRVVIDPDKVGGSWRKSSLSPINLTISSASRIAEGSLPATRR